MFVFKAFKRHEGRLASIVAKKKAMVLYTPKIWTMASSWLAREGYHPTVFKDFSDACSCAQDNHAMNFVEVWLCEGREEMPLPGMAFLSQLAGGEIEVYDTSWPLRTLMFKEVMPLVKVWDRENKFDFGREARAIAGKVEALACELNAEATELMEVL